jgi:hypothetical protein
MKTKDLLTITSVALGTAALTVITFWTDPLGAGNETNAPAATITQPKLVANGVELTLATADGRVFEAGQQPEFELRAVNRLAQASTVAVRVSMRATQMADSFARVVRLPSLLWQEERSITLAPNETKTLTVNATTNLPAGSVISVLLAEVDAAKDPVPSVKTPAASASLMSRAPLGIAVLNFSTKRPEAVIPKVLAAQR